VRLGGAPVREHLDDPQEAGRPAPEGQGAALRPHLVERYLYSRAGSIYGGTSEIQRDLVARALLG
jgi:pimeloyl-CoA dehydrogenase